ncbi:MAG: hypothetical protein R3F29_12860 [Planctomycetota bacterium]
MLRSLLRRLSSLAPQLPPLLRHLWLAMLLHALAGLCLAPLHDAVVHWPAAVTTTLLLSLLVWVVPRARPRALARVGEALVAAGAAIGVAVAIVTVARFVAAW